MGDLVIQFTVHGPPVQWSRAVGKGQRRFNLPEHKAYKRQVALAAWAAGARAHKLVPPDVPLMLSARVFIEPPFDFAVELAALLVGHGRDPIEFRRRPVGKPDLDNWIKLPMDALNGLVWTDDCQVVEFAPGTGKWYSTNPRLELSIWRL